MTKHITISKARQCVTDLLKFMTLNNLNSDDDTIYDSLLLLSERLNKYSYLLKCSLLQL